MIRETGRKASCIFTDDFNAHHIDWVNFYHPLISVVMLPMISLASLVVLVLMLHVTA